MDHKIHLDQHLSIAKAFPDLHPPLTNQAAITEANRCLMCFDAPCTLACPTHIDVPRFIKKIATGNLQGSALSLLSANVLAASCSKVCPVSVLCEGSCVMHHQHQPPIEIALLQRHAMDAFRHANGQLPLLAQTTSPKKIACIGAGPASLACAAELQQRGHQVTIFDQRQLPGGLNTYGVAEYKLRTQDSLREIELIANLGVEFRFATSITTLEDLTHLESEYDILFLGIGLGVMQKLNIPNHSHSSKIIDALSFIETYKTRPQPITAKQVLVIGAGNTAIDAAIAAKHLDADEVTLLYRRAEPNLSAFDFEYAHAKSEGVRFLWLTQPIALDSNGLECQRVELINGAPEPIPNSNFHLPCDLLIPAIGQSPHSDWLSSRNILPKNGRIPVDPQTNRTANPRYYAAGDCTNGGREVVDAVAGGKRAAIAIAAALESTHA